MKGNAWHPGSRELGASCEGLVVVLGLAACLAGAVVGLGLFQLFLVVAGTGGLVFAAISYLARR
jgi:hypothetical protein